MARSYSKLILPKRVVSLSDFPDDPLRVTQDVVVRNGKVRVNTAFHCDDKAGDIPKARDRLLFRAKHGVESSLDVIDHHWRETEQELLEIRKEAKLYADIKLRGGESSDMAAGFVAATLRIFADKYSGSGIELEEFEEGKETSKIYPLTLHREWMDAFRTALITNASAQADPNAPKMDGIEEKIFYLQNSLLMAESTFYKINGYDDRETSQGGIAVAGRGKGGYDSDEPIATKFDAFCDAVETLLDCYNKAWWDAASRLSKGDPVSTDNMSKHVVQMRELFKEVQEAQAQFTSEIENTSNAYELRKLNKLLTINDDRHQGIMPTIASLIAVFNRTPILTSEIEKGFAREKGK